MKITERQANWLSFIEIGGERKYVIGEGERELKKRLLRGVNVLWESVSNDREYCAKSGGRASVVYGVELLGGRDCYYVLTDDEGRSGYGCCGKIRLYYSYDIEKYLEKCYEIDKGDFEEIRKKLNREDYVSKKGRMIDEWVDNVSEVKGEWVDNVSEVKGEEIPNKNITPQFIERHLDKPWDWGTLWFKF